MKSKPILGFAILAVAAVAVTSSAQERKPDPARAANPRMEAMAKAAAPGEAHKKLEPFVGVFSATVKFWSDPSASPEESSGNARNAWALEDRFVEERFEGTLMGQSYTGAGYLGYDNLKKKYTSVWMDTASTATLTSTGAFDAEGKILTFTGTADDPVTGKPTKFTQKVTPGRNGYTLEIWGSDPSGKSYKMMEVAFSRER